MQYGRINKTNSNVAKQRAQWITRGGGVGTAMLVSGIVLKQYYKNSDIFFLIFFPVFLKEGQIRENIQIHRGDGGKRLW